MMGFKSAPGAPPLIRGTLFLLLGAAFIMSGQGCDEPVDLCDPQVPGGRIQGRVLSGGLPLDAYVTAELMDEEHPNFGKFRAEPDETGLYSLDLPFGRYIFTLRTEGGRYDYTASGISYGQFPPDTVSVRSGIRTPDINFVLGGVAIGLDVPDYLNDQYGQVILHRQDDYDGGTWGLVTTGRAEIETGRFEVDIAGVLPGDYQVEVILGCLRSYCGDINGGERFWLPATHDQAESPLYTVAPDSILSLDENMLQEPARIEGRVSGAWLDMGIEREPVVSIVTEDSLLVLKSFHTDEDGFFTADFLVPGPVKILVSQLGIDYWIGGPDFESATVFMLESGHTITEIEHDQCGIHLVVDETGLSYYNGFIEIFNPANISQGVLESSWGNTGRHIGIPNLWPGEFLVQVSPVSWSRGITEWRPQWFDRAATVDLAQPIQLTTGGQVARLDLVMEAGGKISGRVVSADGPLDYYGIQLYPVDDEDPWADRFFGDDTYHLTGLPDGDYVIAARSGMIVSPLEGILWYPGTYDRAEAQVIEIRDASVVEGVDIIIPQ
ncbi:MAG: hypothetical protein ABFS42_09750 [Candidatus Krumholzibacteriota bacterium]